MKNSRAVTEAHLRNTEWNPLFHRCLIHTGKILRIDPAVGILEKQFSLKLYRKSQNITLLQIIYSISLYP